MVHFQRNIVWLAIFIFFVKLVAWYLTDSVAIFTDALESTVNVAAGLFGLYSVWLASKPRDANHPYGHGKIEYVSAAVEGTLIVVAGLLIIYQSTLRLFEPTPIHQLNTGLILISITALANGIVGWKAKKYGKKHYSPTILASGQHLLSDTYSTIGILVGLILVKITDWLWLDALVGFIFAFVILFNGYKVIRSSLAGIMDEADLDFLKEFIALIQSKRKPIWIDLHNLRLIRYGSVMHIDAHMTLPWYFTVASAHEAVQELENIIKEAYQNSVELFIHIDSCKPQACNICAVTNCPERQFPFESQLKWNLENVLRNKQHNT